MLLRTQSGADILLIREQGSPFVVVPESQDVSNGVRMRITNRTDEQQVYNAEIVSPEGARIEGFVPLELQSSEKDSRVFRISAPFSQFKGGELIATIRVYDDSGAFESEHTFKLLGPMSLPKAKDNEP